MCNQSQLLVLGHRHPPYGAIVALRNLHLRFEHHNLPQPQSLRYSVRLFQYWWQRSSHLPENLEIDANLPILHKIMFGTNVQYLF